jgi:glycosyltransferase involved in cell wall biosynthesis
VQIFQRGVKDFNKGTYFGKSTYKIYIGINLIKMCEGILRKEKKVLIIAYYFPPMGMGGVQRATKFAKYLPSFGWKPFVLTVKEVEYLAKDPSLLEDLPPQVKVIRTGSFDPLRISFILKSFFKKRKQKEKSVKKSTREISKLSSWLFFPDSKIGWLPFALLSGLKIIRKERIDLIFTTSPPPSLHLVGYFLKLLTGKPWVADFRDPWIGFHYEDYPTPFHLWLKNRLVGLITQNAKAIVSINEKITQRLFSLYPFIKNIKTVPNGYDESDFNLSPAVKTDLKMQNSHSFIIAYLGTFSPDHDPEPFLLGLRNLLDEKKALKEKIKLKHIGLCMGIDLDKLIKKYDLSEVVERRGYLPHKEALAQLQDVSLFLLTTSPSPEAEMISTSKLFEYMPLKQPVLAIVPPDGAASQIVSSLNLGKVVSPFDPIGIKQELFSFFSDWEKGSLSLNVDEGKIKIFSRKFLTSRLASLFDEII